MKNVLMSMLVIFIPILPAVLLAAPMILLYHDDTNKLKHWSCKVYLWVFYNI